MLVVVTALFVAWPVVIMALEAFGTDLSPIFTGKAITFVGGVPFYSGGFNPTLANIHDALGVQAFPKLVVNSTVIGTANVVLALSAGVPAGYAFARMKFVGKEPIAYALLALRTVSPFAVVLPLYLLYVHNGLWDTYQGMAIAYLALDLPVVVWMLRGFFADVPKEVYEAAEIFGASERQIFARVAIPLVLLGVVATAVFSFVLQWNEFQMANLLTGGMAKTVSVGIWSGAGESVAGFKTVNWDTTNALGSLAFVPVFAMILIIRKYLARGFSLAMAK